MPVFIRDSFEINSDELEAMPSVWLAFPGASPCARSLITHAAANSAEAKAIRGQETLTKFKDKKSVMSILRVKS